MKIQKATRVLVVDDFKAFREWIRSRLKAHTQFEIVAEASTGHDAIHMAELFSPDLILLDLGLPDINGIETRKRLSRVLPSAKILFLFGQAQGDIVAPELGKGSNGHLFKGDAERELVPAIEAVVRGDNFPGGTQETGERCAVPPLHLAPST
jgi:DNA-binding NarL/FixJ family response regulator